MSARKESGNATTRKDLIDTPTVSSDRPSYILFAGINGAGKSTLFRSNLWENGVNAASYPRVNSDEILVAHGWAWEDPAAQVRAGKEAVRRIKAHFAAHESFNQETTLAGRSIMRNIQQAKNLGYRVVIHYVGVEDPRIANERIAHRKAIGGHGISEDVVLRRHETSLNNLVNATRLCNKVLLYDNTVTLRLLARVEDSDLSYYDLQAPGITWQNDIIERLIALQDSHKHVDSIL